MNLPADVCLSPDWVDFFKNHGIDSIHGTAIGPPNAEDSLLFAHAHQHGLIIFTHDLDFGTLLANTKESGPSVIQARVQDPSPEQIGVLILNLLTQFQTQLAGGAIVTLAAETE